MKKNDQNKLQKGDKIAVIAPSDSFNKISSIGPAVMERLQKEFGVTFEYSKNCMAEPDMLGSSSVKSRVDDLHRAFKDTKVKAIICATGGFNVNDLLLHIDWKIIKDNPKPIIGSSDMTVLLNAIYAKTGVTTYHGPNFFKFGMKQGLEYTLEYFQKALFLDESFDVLPSKKWSEDKWWRDQEHRTFSDNDGYIICNPGTAKGKIVGGNLCSFNLLQGTPYMPKLKDAILFIEDDDLAGDLTFGEFYRNLHSLLQQPNADSIKGILIGRFYSKSEMTAEKIKFIAKSDPRLKKIPIIANVDFGHTDPAITFPIGGTVEIRAGKNKAEIKITKH
jgi:muramoyltetrapeptide carboxypeptidase LdcA involved in peptidoglycan recycling